MKDFKKILKTGLQRSNIREEDLEEVEKYLKTDMLEKVQELKDRLGLELYDYYLEVTYEGDCPVQFIHTLDVKFESNFEGLSTIPLAAGIRQIEEILSSGDDEVFIAGRNIGLRLTLMA